MQAFNNRYLIIDFRYIYCGDKKQFAIISVFIVFIILLDSGL